MTPAAPSLPSERTWISRTAHWVAAARSHRVICLVFGIWLLNGFDLAFTVLSHEQGVLHENNPVARWLLQNGPASREQDLTRHETCGAQGTPFAALDETTC